MDPTPTTSAFPQLYREHFIYYHIKEITRLEAEREAPSERIGDATKKFTPVVL